METFGKYLALNNILLANRFLEVMMAELGRVPSESRSDQVRDFQNQAASNFPSPSRMAQRVAFYLSSPSFPKSSASRLLTSSLLSH